MNKLTVTDFRRELGKDPAGGTEDRLVGEAAVQQVHHWDRLGQVFAVGGPCLPQVRIAS